MASPSTARIDDAPRDAAISFAGWCRIIGKVSVVALVLLILLPLHGLVRLFRISSPFPRMFLATTAYMCGVRVRSIGTALRRDVFLVANHISWLDIPVLCGRNGAAFVSKGEVASWPLIGWLAKINHTIFVDRSDRKGVADQINEVREALIDRWAITVFPEGTTGDGVSLLPFKTSLLKVLEPPPPGVMVQPVALDYGAVATEIAWVGDEPFFSYTARLLARKGSYRVFVHFLEPFDPATVGGRKAVAKRAEAKIAQALGLPLPTPAVV